MGSLILIVSICTWENPLEYKGLKEVMFYNHQYHHSISRANNAIIKQLFRCVDGKYMFILLMYLVYEKLTLVLYAF